MVITRTGGAPGGPITGTTITAIIPTGITTITAITGIATIITTRNITLITIAAEDPTHLMFPKT
jgi:predicted regulator of amino acid metabolism with ACT domain